MVSNSEVVAGCVGGAVAWFGMHYAISNWYFPRNNYNSSNNRSLKERRGESDLKNGDNIDLSEYVRLLRGRVKSLQISVVDLEERNERLREANRLLTKLANSAANIGFKEIQDSYKKLENSPKSREEGEMIFIDYPSYEFAVVRPSSNEI